MLVCSFYRFVYNHFYSIHIVLMYLNALNKIIAY